MSMDNFWDKRFSEVDWVYGLEPNVYIKEQLDILPPGKVLFMAEGEGRNAIYAAQQGWDVYAVDQSAVGKSKTLKRAETLGVNLNYQIGNVLDYDLNEEVPFDVIVLCFIHLPSSVRQTFHQSLRFLLKEGGRVIIEGYTPKQLDYGTGGPSSLDMLYTIDNLTKDFDQFSKIHLIENERILAEGDYHKGLSALVEGIIIK